MQQLGYLMIAVPSRRWWWWKYECTWKTCTVRCARKCELNKVTEDEDEWKCTAEKTTKFIATRILKIFLRTQLMIMMTIMISLASSAVVVLNLTFYTFLSHRLNNREVGLFILQILCPLLKRSLCVKCTITVSFFAVVIWQNTSRHNNARLAMNVSWYVLYRLCLVNFFKLTGRSIVVVTVDNRASKNEKVKYQVIIMQPISACLIF